MENTNYVKTRKSDIFKYAFGGLGSNIPYALMMSYLTFFYTDVFGISSAAVAGLMLLARGIDAITDPIMGLVGDRTRSRFGKYRPWIMFGAPILGLTTFLVFFTPDMGPAMKVAYAYTTYILYSLASTVVNIPYHSLTPLLSKNPSQRTAIVASKQGMGVVANALVSVLAMPLVRVFGDGEKGWAIYAALMAITTTGSFLMCAWGGKRHDTAAACESSANAENKLSVWEQLKLVVCNKPLIALLVAFGTDTFANASVSAVNVYYFAYVLHRKNLVAKSAAIMLITGALALLVVPPVAKRFGKKNVYVAGTVLSIIPLALMWMRPDASASFILVSLAILSFFSRIPSTLGWSMLTDCGDYAEWKYGHRGDGIVSASLTFINKLGMALGGSLASLVLGMVGYLAGAEQTPAVLSAIVFLRFGMPILGYVCSLAAMPFYELSTKRYGEILTDLNARKNAAK